MTGCKETRRSLAELEWVSRTVAPPPDQSLSVRVQPRRRNIYGFFEKRACEGFRFIEYRQHVQLTMLQKTFESDFDAEDIARKAMAIAADICVYTNGNLSLETISR